MIRLDGGNWAKYPVEGDAPIQKIVEHGSPIKAWHSGPLKLMTHIPSSAGLGARLLRIGTAVSAVETLALGAYMPESVVSVGGFMWGTTLALSAVILATLVQSVVDGRGPGYDQRVDQYKERVAMLNRLSQISEPVAIVVFPGCQSDTCSKTYTYGVGRLTKQGIGTFMEGHARNTLDIYVKNADGQILEKARLPGTARP